MAFPIKKHMMAQGTIKMPVVVGKRIGLHPIYTFLAIIIGGLAFGPWGLIFGPIVAAIIKAVMYAEDKHAARPVKKSPFKKDDDYIDI